MSLPPPPRPEYPRPQMVRPDWINLNGPWQFEIDHGNSGLERGLCNRPLQSTITVPFCPESKLSGIEHVDFMAAVWYRKQVAIPAAWSGRKVLLHFQACDYDTTVWVNDVEVMRHRGGFTPFTCDLGDHAKTGEQITIVVRARDSHIPPSPVASNRSDTITTVATTPVPPASGRPSGLNLYPRHSYFAPASRPIYPIASSSFNNRCAATVMG